MPLDTIFVKGAREHNLKNIDVAIPRDKLVVITGVSGSGKSSLAFDTVYAEGQRRYVESLSAYARQFLGRMEKPDVDYIEGLSPAISIDQKGPSRNPRSTVGTVTEVYDYLRLLFARVGHPHCPNCGREIAQQTVQQMVDSILELPPQTRISIMAPLVRDRKGEHQAVLDDLRKGGYVRVRVDGRVRDLSEDFDLAKNRRHTIVLLVSVEDGRELLFSEHFACVHCGISLGEIEPRTFSFNSPHGACPACSGLGVKMEIDHDLIIPNKELSIAEGAIHPGWWFSWRSYELEGLSRDYRFSLRVPVKELSEEHLNLILYGEEGELVKHRNRFGRVQKHFTGYEGVVPYLERAHRETESDRTRWHIERYMSSRPCPVCHGQRLKPESLAVTIGGKNIAEVTAMSVEQSGDWVDRLSGVEGRKPILSPRELTIARQVVKEITARLGFLRHVGLDYLTIGRASSTLSGGEAQRIRLATQIGSGLMGVLYICDEPTVGLHAADDYRLIDTLKMLRDLGNTVLVVEHDEAMMRAADHIVDMGPGAGEHGGEIVVAGTIEDIMNSPDSITGQYLSGRKQIALPQKRRPGSGRELVIRGARQNNLKNIDVHVPLGMFVCITGVSGSGKSTLISDILYRKLAQVFYKARERPGDCDGIDGLEHIDKVVNINQSPIGRTPRSNPATYTGTFTPIRQLFATVPEARVRGYPPGRFSFNVKGGRCEACRGEGYIQIEIFKGRNIAEVLEMSVEEALSFFENFPKVRSKLETLRDVGMGYIKLGQPATTLSGGEAQRVKLATELSKRATGRTLYILDEPTTGLSFEDAAALLGVLHRLADAGNTVILIEHHLDLIKNADYIIDLGPGAGDRGGYVIAEGTPEKIAEQDGSFTGQYLRAKLHVPDSRLEAVQAQTG